MSKRHPLKDVFLRLKNAAPVLHQELVEQLARDSAKMDHEAIYADPNTVLNAQGRAQAVRWLLECVVECDPPPAPPQQPVPSPR